MRYAVVILAACIASSAFADRATIGSNGINSLVTGLDGLDVLIGMVESHRPGKPLYDINPANYASNTVPDGVFFHTSGGQASRDSHILDHATGVANIVIGRDNSVTGQTSVNYPDYRGVAPRALFIGTASGSFDQVDLALSLNRTARFGSRPKAINMSFAIEVQFFETNGNSHLTRFVDWSARVHDVLYVAAWGNEGQSEHQRSPADNFNGITVGASTRPTGENVWRKFADTVNAMEGLAHGDSL